jgi:hypothetical protein
MPRKLKITLWITIGLLAAMPAIIEVGYLRAIGVLAGSTFPFVMTVRGSPFPGLAFIVMGLILACGILIVYWTQKTITPVALRRYLLLAGASAIGMLFFLGPVHMLTEAGFVIGLLVCPVTLVVGVILALRFKSTPAS